MKTIKLTRAILFTKKYLITEFEVLLIRVRVRVSSSSSSNNNSNSIIFSVRISSSMIALVTITIIVALGRKQPSARALGELSHWASK